MNSIQIVLGNFGIRVTEYTVDVDVVFFVEETVIDITSRDLTLDKRLRLRMERDIPRDENQDDP